MQEFQFENELVNEMRLAYFYEQDLLPLMEVCQMLGLVVETEDGEITDKSLLELLHLCVEITSNPILRDLSREVRIRLLATTINLLAEAKIAHQETLE